MSLYWHEHLIAFAFMFAFTGLGVCLGWILRGARSGYRTSEGK